MGWLFACLVAVNERAHGLFACLVAVDERPFYLRRFQNVNQNISSYNDRVILYIVRVRVCVFSSV